MKYCIPSYLAIFTKQLLFRFFTILQIIVLVVFCGTQYFLSIGGKATNRGVNRLLCRVLAHGFNLGVILLAHIVSIVGKHMLLIDVGVFSFLSNENTDFAGFDRVR